MKVLACWKIIQLFVEPGEVAGNTINRYREHSVIRIMVNMFICTWHSIKLRIIGEVFDAGSLKSSQMFLTEQKFHLER